MKTIILNCEDIINEIKKHNKSDLCNYYAIWVCGLLIQNYLNNIEFKIIIIILSIYSFIYWILKKKIIFSFYLKKVNYIINIFLNLLFKENKEKEEVNKRNEGIKIIRYLIHY